MKIILASNSARRKEILTAHNIEFEVIPSDVEEVVDESLTVIENVMNLAKIKCEDVYNKHQDRIVLAADTIVVFNNQIYGKPKDELDAFSMLKKLQGNAHQVITAVAIKSEKGLTQGYSVSDVVFNKMSDEDILEYIKTKEPMDKAGSYAIQGIGGKYIQEYIGEFDNIVGLPIKVVNELLNNHR